MQDYFEHIEEKDPLCTRKTETLHSNATQSKGIFGWKRTNNFKTEINFSSFRLWWNSNNYIKNTIEVECVQHNKEWLDLRSFSGEKENYSTNKKIFALFPQNYAVFENHENINSNSKWKVNAPLVQIFVQIFEINYNRNFVASLLYKLNFSQTYALYTNF